MAAEDDGPNFSYAYGNAPSWNPAFRPDHESPLKPAFDRAEVEQHAPLAQAQAQAEAQAHLKAHDESLQEDLVDDDGLPVVPSGPVQEAGAPVLRTRRKDDVPASDDDFFDRYGRPDDAPVVPASPVDFFSEESATAELQDAASVQEEQVVEGADASWEDGAGATPINGTRQEPVETIATKHPAGSAFQPEQGVAAPATATTASSSSFSSSPPSSQRQPVKHMYEHQGTVSGLEGAVQESAEQPLVAADVSAGEEAWGASDDWQIGGQDVTPAVDTAAFSFDAQDQDVAALATEEPRQPDMNAAIFSMDETTLASQDAQLAADTARVAAQVPSTASAGAPPETEATAVPQAAQESSQDEWGADSSGAFDFDATAREEFLADVTSAGTEVKAAPTDDLADAWAGVAGDDDFLTEDAAAAFGFDVDDGDGFLDEGVDTTATGAPLKTRHARSASTSKYTPANVPQSGLPPPSRTSSYRPEAPNLVDLSTSLQQSTPVQRAPAASPYASAYQTQPAQRPAVSSAESFADKAKGGYHSPYDLPDDLAIKRRRPAAHAPAPSPAMPQAAPPPRLSSMQSMSSMGPPKQSSPITPAFPGTSPVQSQGQFRAAPTATQPSKAPNRDEGFFADLPAAPRPPRQSTPSRAYSPHLAATAAPPSLGPPAPIRPASTSYAPQQPPPRQQDPADQSGLPQLQPAERIPLYSDDAQQQQRSTTMPPPASRYSPAVPPASKSSYSPAPATTPPAANASRYSPAPGAKNQPVAASRQPSDAVPVPPRAQAQLYTPRTSSPLAFHSLPSQDRSTVTPPQSDSHPTPPGKANLNRLGSAVSISGLETVNENAEPTFSPPTRPDAPQQAPTPSSRNSTPPPPPRSQPSSIVSSPRKRGTYAPANYQPMVAQGDQSIVPPKRSQSSSPSAAMKFANVGTGNLERPASVAALQSTMQTSFVKQPNRMMSSSLGGPAYHEMNNLVQPRDESVHDPLQRWKGVPIFHWGNGNSIVTSFPRYTPMYGAGSMEPMVKPTASEIKTGIVNTICPQSDIFQKFPGPLKKGKKKEVIAWLKASADQLEADHKTASMNGELTTAMHTRSEERILLWRVMTLLIEHDGALEGNPAIDASVRAVITPSTSDAVLATEETELSRANAQPEAFDPQAVKTMRAHLYAGEREKAVWHAVDQRLWAHALLIASTLNDKEIWKQVVQEFVRKEVRKIGENTEALAALYQVFAGNWEESIDELVSVSARSGFQMVSTAGGGTSQKDALAGLDKWRETLLLVLNNRSAGDAAALASLGNLLNGYGRIEAGHICFLFARSNAKFGGADDPQSHFSLVGGHSSQQGSDFGHSLDTILLSEVYEFAMMASVAPALSIQHLQAYKLYHAEVLAEAGKRAEAQQYCDAITSIVTAKANRSPYYNPQFMRWLDDFARRLSQAPADKSDSSWKPSMDKVSSSIWGKFNNFIVGESDAADASAAGLSASDGIPESFAPMGVQTPVFQTMPQMPPMGRTTSSSDVFGGFPSNGHPVPSPQVVASNSRYAPGNNGAYTPRSSSEQQRPKYTPNSQSAYEPRTSMESSRSVYEPQSSNEYGMVSTHRAGAPGSSHSAVSQYAPLGQQAVHTPPSGYAPEGLGVHGGSLHMPAPLQHTTSEQGPSYLPTPPMESSNTMNGFTSTGAEGDSINQFNGLRQEQQPITSSGYGYEPPTSTYEPATYQPYQQEDELPERRQEEDQDVGKLKKSFMDDDDDDDLTARAAMLKKSQKSDADRQADEAFRKAAEADAAKAAAEKAGGAGPRGSWFGGWFGGKKQDPNAPVVHKAKLGEESSFYFDKDLGRWVNKKGGADAATPAAATPPPPKLSGPPSRPASGMMAPPAVPSPAKSGSPASVGSAPPLAPPQRSASAQLPPQAGPVAALTGAGSGGGPPSRPPSRPSTSMSNASDIDDLLGPAAPRKAGGRKAGARKGRYVDVMANK